MIRNASFQRKVIYLAIMIPILAALAYLGLPAKGKVGDPRYFAGGKLARLRVENELSQANLGEIDPASETMKLATLGLRPVAANILWDRANEYKKIQAWDALSATLNQISKLQPNFITVWEFQAHNLSYNVSVEFDDFRQRYHWVKKGIEFLLVGTQYNKNEPKLPWNLGWFTGQKIGRADEKVQFRRMFRVDRDFHKEYDKYIQVTDNREAEGPDGNPDNWKVGRLWYLIAVDLANEKSSRATDLSLWRQTRGKVGGQIEAETQKGRSSLLIHVDPAMSLINYSAAIQEEGRVGEVAQVAWQRAARGWEEFGRQPIRSSWGQTLFLYNVEENLAKMAALEAELDSLAPGARQKLFDERVAKLTPAQRAALNLKQTELTGETYQPHVTAVEATRVTNFEVAELAAESAKPKARRLATQIFDLDVFVNRTKRYRDQVNYEYWKTRCEAESSDLNVRARRHLYEAQQHFEKADLQKSREEYQAAWNDWAEVLEKYPLLLDGTTAQDLADPLRRYRNLLDQLGEDFPSDFKLYEVIKINQQKGHLSADFAPTPPATPEKKEPDPEKSEPEDSKPEKPEPDDPEKPKAEKPAGDEEKQPAKDQPAEPKSEKPAEPDTPVPPEEPTQPKADP